MSYNPNYVLASSAGYKFDIANIGENLFDPGTIKNKEHFKDVVVTHRNNLMDLSLIDSHTLVTVNGLIHPTVYQDGLLFIEGANEVLLKTNKRAIGITSFLDAPVKPKKFKIEEDMIFNDGDYKLHQRVNFKFKEKVDGLIFVFMGYIITEQKDVLKRVSDTEFVFYPDNINLIDRIYELDKYIDIFDKLGIETSDVNRHVFEIHELTKDETIKKMLTLFNTFVVTFDGHLVSNERIYLEHSAIPNNFRTEERVSYPLIGGRGKVIEYLRKQFNTTKYTLLTVDGVYDNLIESYTPVEALALHNRNRRMGDMYRINHVFFLKLSIDPIETD